MLPHHQNKLDAGEYAKASEVIEEIDLVWNNCKTYNQVGYIHTERDE